MRPFSSVRGKFFCVFVFAKFKVFSIILTFVHGLIPFQGISFELGAATVDPQSPGYDPKPLVHYLASLGVPYFFEEQGGWPDGVSRLILTYSNFKIMSW